MQVHSSDLEDEIDLRGLINSLLRYKWWILGVALGVAVVTFLVSEFQTEKNYQARSLVVFGQPTLNVNTGSTSVSNVNLNPAALPDSKGITDLAVVDDMLYKVFQSPELAQTRAHGLSFPKFKQKLNATLSGTNQLLLQASDPDADQAALAANLWAEAVANRLNGLYGASNLQITALEQQTQKTQKAWEAAEKALVDYLPQSQVDALTAQLNQAQIAYNAQLGRLYGIDLILSDGRALDGRLSAQQPNVPLAAGDAIGLLALQQRANQVLLCNSEAVPAIETVPSTRPNQNSISGIDQSINCSSSDGLGGLQVQISGSSLLAGQSTVADAQQALKLFTDALKTQQTELKDGLAQMEKQLSDIRTQTESAQFHVNQLIEQRDLTKMAYETVSGELSSTQIEVVANGQVARVAGKAMRPAAPASRVVVNTVVAGLGALMLMSLAMLIVDWWRGSLGKASR